MGSLLQAVSFVGLAAIIVFTYWLQIEAPLSPPPDLSYATIEHENDIYGVMADALPMRLNYSAFKWPAFGKWTPEYVKQQLGRDILPFCKNGTSNVFILRNFDKPLQTTAPTERWYNLEDVEVNKFFEKSKTFLYFSGKLEWWPETLIEDVHPTEPFLIKETKNEDWKSQIMVWMGHKDVIANCHYDRSHNVFFQVSGRKIWTLFPPTAWQSLYLFPHIDGAYHQTQIGKLNESNPDLFPLFNINNAAYQVLLEPGDAIYVPPYWFHQVEALDFGISVSIVSPSKVEEIAGAVMYEATHLLIPRTSTQSFPALIYSIERILYEVYFRLSEKDNLDKFSSTSMTIKQRISLLLLHSRYFNVPLKDNIESCSHIETIVNTGLPEEILDADKIEAKLDHIINLLLQLPTGVRETTIGDLIEESALQLLVKPWLVNPFLVMCF